MRKYWTLYVKELKALKAPFLMLVMTYIFFILYLLFSGLSQSVLGNVYNYRNNLFVFIRISLFILPVILFYSFYDERTNRTFHQAFSLSIPRYAVMLYKFLALLSAGVVAALLLTLYYYIFELKFRIQTSYSHNPMHPLKYALIVFSIIYVLLCIVNATVGILSTIKRYHVLSGIFVFGIFYMLYRFFNRLIISLLESIFLGYKISLFGKTEPYQNGLIALTSSILPFMLGSIFFLFGLYVFHKYSDI